MLHMQQVQAISIADCRHSSYFQLNRFAPNNCSDKDCSAAWWLSEFINVKHLLPSHLAMVAVIRIRRFHRVERSAAHIWGWLQAELFGAPKAWRLKDVPRFVKLWKVNLTRTSVDRTFLADDSPMGTIPVLVHLYALAGRCMAVEVCCNQVTATCECATDCVNPPAILIP